MKIANYFFLLAFIVLSSCSTSSNSSEEEGEIINPTAEFEFNINGTPKQVSVEYAYKKSQTIHIGTDSNNTTFLISFDENGHFGKIICEYFDPTNLSTKKFTTYREFSSNYFNFQLISYDAVNKRVKATFYGNVYYDPANLNSEAKFISGSFDLPYQEYIPAVANIINEATINGGYWRSTNKYQVRQNTNFHDITLHSLSDDAYKIMLNFNSLNATPGIYNFTNSSTTNKAQIAKYNTSTSSYTLYDCTGTFTIANKWSNCIKGTYSFVGVNPANPSDIITVENGNFKLDYDQYH